MTDNPESEGDGWDEHFVAGIDGWIPRGFTDPPGELGLGNPTHWMPLPSPPEYRRREVTKPERRCARCKAHLLSQDELDFGVCEDCAERAYHREQKRREWDHYHPGEPCPEIELE